MTDLEHAKQIHKRLWQGVIDFLSIMVKRNVRIPETEADFSDVQQLEKYDWFYWREFRSTPCMYHKDGACPCALHCYVSESPYYQFVKLSGTSAYARVISLAEQIRDCWR